ncbi:hypothetical protein GGR53DRAFT_319210 [Hypoxylon sp. FL1150]|nr:hypothetical protein GGR53DRAFT_319210 [Hypoxylon sp. FL1150]
MAPKRKAEAGGEDAEMSRKRMREADYTDQLRELMQVYMMRSIRRSERAFRREDRGSLENELAVEHEEIAEHMLRAEELLSDTYGRPQTRTAPHRTMLQNFMGLIQRRINKEARDMYASGDITGVPNLALEGANFILSRIAELDDIADSYRCDAAAPGAPGDPPPPGGGAAPGPLDPEDGARMRAQSIFHNLPLDLIRSFVEVMDTETRLRILWAYPSIFRDGHDKVNILRIEAEAQRSLVQPGPNGQADDDEPMLSFAIRENMGLSVITAILNRYDEALGRNSVDEMYLHRQHTPPLILAIQASRPDVVRLLLDRGADIDISHPDEGYGCDHEPFVHSMWECNQGSDCQTAFLEARMVFEYNADQLNSDHELYSRARETLIYLYLRALQTDPGRVREMIMSLFGHIAADFSDIIKTLIGTILTYDPNDVVRQSLEGSLGDILVDIANHRTSVHDPSNPTFPFHHTSAVASSFFATIFLQGLARSDDLIRYIVLRPETRINCEHIFRIACNRTQWRAANVVLQYVMKFAATDPTGGEIIQDVIDQYMSSGMPEALEGEHGGSPATLRQWVLEQLLPMLNSRNLTEPIQRLVYCALRDDRPRLADRIMNDPHGRPEPPLQAFFAAIFQPMIPGYYRTLGARMNAFAVNINEAVPVDGPANPNQASLDRNWHDALVRRGLCPVDAAILQNWYEAALALLQDHADPSAIHPDLIAFLRSRREDVDAGAVVDWSQPAPMADEDGLLPAEIRQRIMIGDPGHFRALTDFLAPQLI